MVDNVQKIEIPGVGVGTSFEINPGQLRGGSVVLLNTAMPGSQPVITTMEAMTNAIRDRGRLTHGCGRCQKRPAAKQQFARCAKCRGTYYCSRECQVAHWPQHKSICKDRVATAARLEQRKIAALAKGKVYVGPQMIQTWFKKNNATIEYAASHILELHKGVRSSMLATHFALFEVEADKTKPDDPSLMRFKDAGPAPLNKIETFGPINTNHLKQALDNGYMILYFLEMKHNLALLEFQQGPLPEDCKYDNMWKINTIFKINAPLPDMNEQEGKSTAD